MEKANKECTMTITARRKTKQAHKAARKKTKSTAKAGVRLVYPNDSPTAIERGQRLAEQIRKELAGLDNESLNETMSQLRGREWS
jgi:hypothetical protein